MSEAPSSLLHGTEDTVTKLYFDYDHYRPDPPDQALLDDILDALLNKEIKTLIEKLASKGTKACEPRPEPDFAVAVRHGWVERQGSRQFKVSFRVFVTNYAIANYVQLGTLVKDLGAEGLDASVYKGREQLLNLVRCRKGPKDARVLQPLEASRPLTDFFASHLTGSEFQVQGRVQQTTLHFPKPCPSPSGSTRDSTHPVQLNNEEQCKLAEMLEELVLKLKPSRAVAYPEWSKVIWAIANVSRDWQFPGPAAHYLVHTFSRRAGSAAYDPEATDRLFEQTRREGRGLGIGSLLFWLQEDGQVEMKQRAMDLLQRMLPQEPSFAARLVQELQKFGFPPSLKITQQTSNTWTFAAPSPMSDGTCIACGHKHPHNQATVSWILTCQEARSEVISIRSAADACQPRIICPLKAFLEDNLRKSELPRLLQLRNPEDLQVVEEPAYAVVAHSSNHVQPVRLGLPLSLAGDQVYHLLGQPQLPLLAIKDIKAEGWTGEVFTPQKMAFVNRCNEPAARLECDWTHAPRGQLERAILTIPGTGKKPCVVKPAELAKIQTAVEQALEQHVCTQLGVDSLVASTLFNINFYQNTNVTIYNVQATTSAAAAEAQEKSELQRLFNNLLQAAEEQQLRKTSGYVWSKVNPVAYQSWESYANWVNRVLGDELAGHVMHTQNLVKLLTDCTNLSRFPEIETDTDLIAFSNGVFRLSTAHFTPFSDAAGMADILQNKVARHYIPQVFNGSLDTPCFDRIARAQLSNEMYDWLLVCIGRLLFPLGTLDNWQVMPIICGEGRTGKSTIIKGVQELFAENKVATLSENNERTFGLDSLIDRQERGAHLSRPSQGLQEDRGYAAVLFVAGHGLGRQRQRRAQEPKECLSPLASAHVLGRQLHTRLHRHRQQLHTSADDLQVQPVYVRGPV